jgi:hypothetical protein
MPQKIEDPEILKHIEKLYENHVAITDLRHAHIKMNGQLQVMMDNAYGKTWCDINYATKEYTTDEEIDQNSLVYKNPKWQERITRDDVDDIQDLDLLAAENAEVINSTQN